jgi:hypothetical protein
VGYQQQDAPALGVFAGVRQLINAGRPNVAPNIVDAGGNNAAKTSLISVVVVMSFPSEKYGPVIA